MTLADFAFVPELAGHDAAIEEINAEAFGPGRFTRAAYRIREGGPHDRALSFVATDRDGEVVASVRMTPVTAGAGAAHLLGPLAVRPAFKNLGIGRKLVAIAVEAARGAGSPAVLLVGDAPYYGPLGFTLVSPAGFTMPRPIDPERLLVHEIAPGATARLTGELRHARETGFAKPARCAAE